MGRQHQQSLRSKAAHFVSDLTTDLLNPIFDKPSKPHLTTSPVSSISEEKTGDLVDGPYTFSFTAFLYSLLSSLESAGNPNLDEQVDDKVEKGNPSSNSTMKETGGRISLFSKGKQTLSRAVFQVARIGGFPNHKGKGDSNSDMKMDGKNENGANFSGLETRHLQKLHEPVTSSDSPDISKPSMLLSENTRTALYASLPAIVQGRKWLLLYSTWSTEILTLVLYCHHSFFFAHCQGVGSQAGKNSINKFKKKNNCPTTRMDHLRVIHPTVPIPSMRPMVSIPSRRPLVFTPSRRLLVFLPSNPCLLPPPRHSLPVTMLWIYGFIYVRIFYFISDLNIIKFMF
ncbi:hypothetical protein UlMin_022827 [Ulmus minor]